MLKAKRTKPKSRMGQEDIPGVPVVRIGDPESLGKYLCDQWVLTKRLEARVKSLSSWELRIPHLDDEELRIVRALAEESGRVIFQVDLADRVGVSLKTIGRRMPRLLRLRLVGPPEDREKGYIILPYGLRVAKLIL